MTSPTPSLALLLTTLLAPPPLLGAPPEDAPVTLAAAGGDAELTLGIRAETSAVRKEVTGFVGLSVPLERVAAPRRVAAAEAPPAPPGEPLPPAEERPGAGTAPVPQPPGPKTELGAAQLSTLARGALAAARRLDHATERERALDGLASRARLSAVLPEVRFRVARTRDESLRLTPTSDDPYRFTLAGGDALVLEGAATFRLSRLVFADEELAVERLRLERERASERRTTRVLERVLAFHAALARLAATEDDAERLRFSLELEAAVVELDVLTGGWFGARAQALGLLPHPSPAAPPPAPPRVTAPERREPPPAPSLDALRLSARPVEPCLPMHGTESATFSGASMR